MTAVHGDSTGNWESGANAIGDIALRRLSYRVSGMTPTIS